MVDHGGQSWTRTRWRAQCVMAVPLAPAIRLSYRRHVRGAPFSTLLMDASPSWRLLPAPAARVLFGALAVDERLRCREVCTGWRDALDCDPPTWAHLDMRPAASLSLVAQGHMLRAAAARARGKVRSLALAFPSEPLDEATVDALAELLPETDPARGAEEAAAALRSFLDDRLLPVLRENRFARLGLLLARPLSGLPS